MISNWIKSSTKANKGTTQKYYGIQIRTHSAEKTNTNYWTKVRVKEYAHLCVHICSTVYARVHMFMQMHSPMHAHLEVRGQGIIFYLSPPYFLRQSLSLDLKHTHILLEYLPPSAPALGLHMHANMLNFTGALVIFAQQAFYPLSHFLNTMNT